MGLKRRSAASRRRERDAQAPAHEHHHHPGRTGALREVLRVADERDAGVVDDRFVHRRGDERGELARLAACDRAVEERDHVGRVAPVKLACTTGESERDVQARNRIRRHAGPGVAQPQVEPKLAGAALEHPPVPEHHDAGGRAAPRKRQADIRADSRRLPRGDCDDRFRGSEHRRSAHRSSSRSST